MFYVFLLVVIHLKVIICNYQSFVASVLFVLTGVYHQFDTLIYPSLPKAKIQEAKSTWESIKSAWSSIKGMLPGFSQADQSTKNESPEATLPDSDDVFPLPDMEHIRKTCLEVYLNDHLKVLKTGVIDMAIKPDDLIKDVHQIYHCLHELCIQDGTPKKLFTYSKVWKSKNLKEVCDYIIIR